MTSSSWFRRKSDASAAAPPKRPIPPPLQLDDGPQAPCDFMPQPSHHLMMFSPLPQSKRRFSGDRATHLLTPSSDDFADVRFVSEEEAVERERTMEVGEAAGRDTNGGASDKSSPTFPTPTTDEFVDDGTDLQPENPPFLRTAPTRASFPALRGATSWRTIGIIMVFLAFLFTIVLLWRTERLHSWKNDFLTFLTLTMSYCSNAIELGLEGIGFLIGRAVGKIAKGFVRGYHMD